MIRWVANWGVWERLTEAVFALLVALVIPKWLRWKSDETDDDGSGEFKFGRC